MTVKLLTNVGAASGVDITGDFQTWNGGPGDFTIRAEGAGSLGGGVVELQATANDGNNVICIAELDVEGVLRFNLNHGWRLRGVLAETTSESSGVFAEII